MLVRGDKSAVLSGHEVIAYVDNTPGRPQTDLLRLAASKRRAYRTLVSWAGTRRLYGHIAERAVLASLIGLRGRTLSVPDQRAGDIPDRDGVAIPGEALD